MYSLYREKILELAARTSLEHLAVPHFIKGPQGERLFTDYFFTPGKKDSCLVHLSGVHGVEGYLGSLIQQEILKQDLGALPFQFVMVHTVNPYGMAAKSRTNSRNVDLNRNSLKHYQIENPFFPAFEPFLSTGKLKDFLRTLPVIFRLGFDSTAQAVACGQTEFPRSLFYCGRQRQLELVSLQENLRLLVDESCRLFAMDIHTGLGKRGQESLIIEGFSEKQIEEFEALFGKRLTKPEKDPGFYQAHGTLAQLFRERWPDSIHCYQEFGTEPFYKVLSSLIHDDPEQRLHVFFPDDSEWKKRCVDLGLLRFQQLVHYFTEPASQRRRS